MAATGSWGTRLAGVLLGLGAGLGLAELGLRAAERFRPAVAPPVNREPATRGPQISRWGRGGSDGRRLLVVGDSFTFGAGVEVREAYPARLARWLDGVEVVSYSRPGWNTRAQARALQEDLPRIDPDVLILGFCLNDAEPRPTSVMMADRPDLAPWERRGPVEVRLARASRLYGSVRRAIDAIRLRPRLRAYYRSLYHDPEGYEDWRRALRRLDTLARRESVPVVLVIFPIFDSDLDHRYAYRDLHGRVATTAEALGWRVLDLLPTYAGSSGRDLALVPFTDPHPSSLAHAIAAETIARYLASEDLLRKPVSRRRRGGEQRSAPGVISELVVLPREEGSDPGG